VNASVAGWLKTLTETLLIFNKKAAYRVEKKIGR
jgi:hypothetical protein